MLQGIGDEREYRKTESALAGLIFLPMNRSTFLLAAETYRNLRSRGITIRNSVDCMIAAVCMENRAQLLHNDRDFDYIANASDILVISIQDGDLG